MIPNPIEAIRRLLDQTLTAEDVVRGPLFSVDPDLSAGESLKVLDAENFDVAGVARPGIHATSYVTRDALRGVAASVKVGAVAVAIPSTLCVERALPLGRLIDVLRERSFTFMLNEDAVHSVITRSDLESPAVAVGVLSLIMVVESQLAKLNREALGSAEDLVALLPDDRRMKAEALFEKRCADNSEIGIDTCLYMADWIELTCRSETYRWIGYGSTGDFRREFRPLEDLRNDLAHNRSILNGRSPSEAVEIVASVRLLGERLVAALADPEHYMVGTVNIAVEVDDGEWKPISGPKAEAASMLQTPVYVVSAMNAHGIMKSLKRNRNAHRGLLAWMSNQVAGWSWTEAHCWSESPPWQESCVAISGVESAEVFGLAKRFGQTSIYVLEDETTTLIGIKRDRSSGDLVPIVKQRVARVPADRA